MMSLGREVQHAYWSNMKFLYIWKIFFTFLYPYLVNTVNLNNFKKIYIHNIRNLTAFWYGKFLTSSVKGEWRDFQGIYETLVNFAIMVDIYNRKMWIEVKDLGGWKRIMDEKYLAIIFFPFFDDLQIDFDWKKIAKCSRIILHYLSLIFEF
jgi:hypothetical protein